MENIDIRKLANIRDELNNLKKDDVLLVNDGSETKYAILPIELYDKFEELSDLLENGYGAEIRVSDPSKFELTYEEYESIKHQIIEAFDKSFKPKPGKMN